MRSAVHGAVLALRAVYETLAISVPTVADGDFSRETVARSNARLTLWSRRLLAQAEVDLTVEGQEHLEPGRPYVVMSNHASHYDVPVLFQAWPGTMRMVAKTELYRVPVFGRAMTAAGFIEIDRSNRERAIASLKIARERLAMGISVWIAPEGTRSRTGELKPFKKGGFMLAMETGLSVAPVGIVGSRDILPVGTRWVQPGARVHVVIGRPISVPPLASGHDARDRLMAEVRAAIEAAAARGREVLSNR
ncbi:MAG: lysophospholipid acyltransferase family protein [Deltaproteobacteria bacterium]